MSSISSLPADYWTFRKYRWIDRNRSPPIQGAELRPTRPRGVQLFRSRAPGLLPGGRSGSLARDTRSDVAISRYDAAESKESIPGSAAKAAGTTTAGIRRVTPTSAIVTLL